MREKILIADDDLFITTLYETKLHKDGMDVVLASNGEEAIQKLQTFVPDIILLDLQMPKINGVQVLTYIRAHPCLKNIPVIVFSNAFANNLVDQAWAAGATKFITKNQCTPNGLVLEVRETLEEANNPPESEAPPALEIQNTVPLSLRSGAASKVAPASSFSPAPVSAPVLSRASETPSPPFSSTAVASEFGSEVFEHVRAFLISEGDESGRAALLDLYQSIQSQLKSARQADRLTRRGRLGSALEKLIEYLYEFPKEISESNRATLAGGVILLGQMYRKEMKGREPVVQAEQVLVIAENKDDRDTISEVLNQEHICTICLSSLEQAIPLFEENRFNLIFLDSKDDDGGIAMCLEAASTPLVTAVEQNLFKQKSKALAGEMSGVIAKPYIPAELTLSVLTRALRPQII